MSLMSASHAGIDGSTDNGVHTILHGVRERTAIIPSVRISNQ